MPARSFLGRLWLNMAKATFLVCLLLLPGLSMLRAEIKPIYKLTANELQACLHTDAATVQLHRSGLRDVLRFVESRPDLFPTETLEFKKKVLPKAVEENWICHFYHDVEAPLCRLVEVDGKITACPIEY